MTAPPSKTARTDWPIGSVCLIRLPFPGSIPHWRAQIIDETVEDLRPVLLHDGVWYVDYVRIRFKVRKL